MDIVEISWFLLFLQILNDNLVRDFRKTRFLLISWLCI